jgi:rubrerythrin
MTPLALTLPGGTEPLESSQPLSLLPERREIFCADCGYGAVVREEPPACPMCRGSSWAERGRTTLAT